jgi:hypothetical protein
LDDDLIRAMRETCRYCGDNPGPWEDPNECPSHDNPNDMCEQLITPDDFHNVVCERCGGEGVLAGWPGAYTESDRAEWSDDDYDDYRNHRRACEGCDGLRVVKALTPGAEARPEVQKYLDEIYDSYRISAMERAMGA